MQRPELAAFHFKYLRPPRYRKSVGSVIQIHSMITQDTSVFCSTRVRPEREPALASPHSFAAWALSSRRRPGTFRKRDPLGCHI